MGKSDDALQYALRLLGYRPRTVHEITERLMKKDYSEESVCEAVTKLKEWGYLDDIRFTEDWIQNRFASKPMGPIRLQSELRKKGIASEIITEKLDEAFDATSEFELARRLARSKYRNESDWRKVAGLLKRRGFSYSVIVSVREDLGVAADEFLR